MIPALGLAILSICPAAQEHRPGEAAPVDRWWVDSLSQLSRDAPAGKHRIEGRLDAARGEVEAIQLAVRARAGTRVEVSAEPFAPGMTVRVRAVGRVPIVHGTHRTPIEERVAEPPIHLPDPLFERRWLELEPERTETFWLDVRVPAGADPGEYATSVRVLADEGPTELPLRLRVHAAAVPFQGALRVTNWFRVDPERMGFGETAIGSEAWWDCAEACFDSMWAHRQDTFWTPLREPWVQPRVMAGGELVFDFSFLERWVESFSRPRGGQRRTWIEGQPVTARQGYDGELRARVWRVVEGEVERVELPPSDPAAEEGYRLFLGALRHFLADRGWLDRFRLHIADEPHGHQLEPYGAIAGYVRRYAPGLVIMEALDVHGDYAFFEEHCDVWVPQLGRFGDSLPRLRERLEAGREVWFYTCLFPNGRYPNRFVDYPLIKTRVLPWINHRWGFTGFLHWGWNHWRGGDPFRELEPPHGSSRLPPGDAWIVYPGERGVLDSIRHEAFRDGIEDFELLGLLAASDPERARAIAGRVVRSFTDFERDPATFRAARAELLEALER